jgi:hypothetical protein
MLAADAQYVSGGFSQNGSPANRGTALSAWCSIFHAISNSRGSSGVKGADRPNTPKVQISIVTVKAAMKSGRKRAASLGVKGDCVDVIVIGASLSERAS